jgi:hypothetical protein
MATWASLHTFSCAATTIGLNLLKSSLLESVGKGHSSKYLRNLVKILRAAQVKILLKSSLPAYARLYERGMPTKNKKGERVSPDLQKFFLRRTSPLRPGELPDIHGWPSTCTDIL